MSHGLNFLKSAHLAFPFPHARPVSHSSPHSLHAAPLPRSLICRAHLTDTLRARHIPSYHRLVGPFGQLCLPHGRKTRTTGGRAFSAGALSLRRFAPSPLGSYVFMSAIQTENYSGNLFK
jgi:hypothetical protein